MLKKILISFVVVLAFGAIGAYFYFAQMLYSKICLHKCARR